MQEGISDLLPTRLIFPEKGHKTLMLEAPSLNQEKKSGSTETNFNK